jgi:very-short-patch-repair endonuclease
MKQKARNLRKNMTDAERLLWQRLRNRQIQNSKFRRQYVIHPYIVDFVCLEHSLVLEIDGGQHAEQIEYDTRRTEYLRSKGYNVLRFWNNEVLQETDAVLNQIYEALSNNPSPQPSPLAGERE